VSETSKESETKCEEGAQSADEHRSDELSSTERRSSGESSDERTSNEKSTKDPKNPIDDRLAKLGFDPEAG